MKRHDLLLNDIITYIEFKALFLDFTDIESAKKFKLQGNNGPTNQNEQIANC